MTAEMTAEGLLVPPAVDGEPVTEGTPEEEKRRRRKKALLLFLLGLLAMLITIAIWYLIFRQPINPPIPTIPQSQIPAYSTSVYGAKRPMGVAVSPSGDRIYVAETEGDRVVRMFDGGGNPIGTMVPPEATGTEHVPVYLAIDPLTSEVYVTDRLASAIYVYDADGRYQRTFTPAVERKGWQPLGIAFDPAGHLYVSDLSGLSQTVVEFDRQGKVVRTIGESAGLNFPNGIAIDGSGYVYVADSSNGRLLVFDEAGSIKARVGRGSGLGNLGLPRGLAVDGQGRVFVADSSGQTIFVYRALQGDEHTPEFLDTFGVEGVADGAFEYPNAVAVDGRGRLYIADSANDRIQIWSY